MWRVYWVIYFLTLYPIGHLGAIPVTIFVLLPLRQVSVIVFALGFAEVDVVGAIEGLAVVGVGEGLVVAVGLGLSVEAGTDFSNLREIVGEEK
jgi:hypothetical protein